MRDLYISINTCLGYYFGFGSRFVTTGKHGLEKLDDHWD